MKSRLHLLGVFALIAVLALSACSAPLAGSPDDEPTEEPTAEPTAEPTSEGSGRSPAYVDVLDVLILESFPVQVNAVLMGNLPDPCVTIDSTEVSGPDENNTFTITITTYRDPVALCAEALTPFEQTVSLPVEGLPAGTYTVVLAGDLPQSGDSPVPTATFELATDNLFSSMPAVGEGLGVVYVSSIEFNELESDPAHVEVLIRGDLSNGCTSLGEITIEGPDEQDTFFIHLPALRPADAICTEALVPFEATVLLPVEGLEAGTYTFIAADFPATFEWAGE